MKVTFLDTEPFDETLSQIYETGEWYESPFANFFFSISTNSQGNKIFAPMGVRIPPETPFLILDEIVFAQRGEFLKVLYKNKIGYIIFPSKAKKSEIEG